MAFFRRGNVNYFLEQWDRVIRWNNQCIGGINTPTDQLPNGLDYYFAFFMNAYHLKDWLSMWAIENQRQALADKLSDDFKNIHCLRILKDLCNASKHFELKGPSISKQFATPRSYSLGKIEAILWLDGNQGSLHDLVKQITEYWSKFMKDNNLDRLKHDISGPLLP